MSAWTVSADGHQRRREGDMTLSVKPSVGGYKWVIARGGAVVAGGWARLSFEALDAADKAAEKEAYHAAH